MRWRPISSKVGRYLAVANATADRYFRGFMALFPIIGVQLLHYFDIRLVGGTKYFDSLTRGRMFLIDMGPSVSAASPLPYIVHVVLFWYLDSWQ